MTVVRSRVSRALRFLALILGVAAPGVARAGVVCSNTNILGNGGYMATVQDVDARRLYRCPAGATQLVFVYAGTTATGVPIHEVPNPADLHVTIAVETGLAVPETGGPAPSIGALSGTKIPVLCGGQAVCTIPAGGLLRTDPVAVRVPRGGVIAIDEHFTHSQAATGVWQPIFGGSLEVVGPSLPDFTRKAATPEPRHAAADMGPQAIIGAPLTPTLGACVIGDSRAVGLAGAGLAWATPVSGGHGYVSADIGQILQNVSSGGSVDDTSVPASYVIRAVSGGAVTDFAVWAGGHYAPALDGNVTPSGVQATIPLGQVHGTGFTVSVGAANFSMASGVFYDPGTTATGYVEKGLADAGVPAASFTRSSDRLIDWLSGDAARVAVVTASGCDVALIELGQNDVNAGYDADQIEGFYVALANQLKAAGVRRVYGMTLLPFTLSRNAYRDAAGQTPVNPAQEAVRQQVNHWIRANHVPFSGEFDTALTVEVNANGAPSRTGGRWIANGVPHFATLDRIHLNVGSSVLAAGEISRHIARLAE